MNASPTVRPLRAVTIFGLVAAGLIPAGAASAAAKCQSWGGQPPNVGSGYNQLEGVAATSACNALAVGYDNNGTANQTLILRWSGSAWRVQPSSDPGGSANDNDLSGVAATSPTNAWAVGYYYNGAANQTLIEHWNGKAWKVQPSPNPGRSAHSNDLSDVAAISSTNAWAVGSYFDGTTSHTLVEHWNGHKWKVQPSPSPGNSLCLMRAAVVGGRTAAALAGQPIGLSGVAASSSGNAWAVGVRCSHGGTAHTLVEHWNGNAWKVQSSPHPGGAGNSSGLSGVAATSSGNAWAVGSYSKDRMTPGRTLVEHWNGKAWVVQSSPNPGGSADSSGLADVAATSPTNAWAVGSYGSRLADPPVVERWNGKTWKIQPSSNFPAGVLFGVAAISSSDAWAVGSYNNGTNNQNLILHCC